MVDEWEIDLKEPLISIVLWNHKHSIPHWKNTNFFLVYTMRSWRVKQISLDKGLSHMLVLAQFSLGTGTGMVLDFL